MRTDPARRRRRPKSTKHTTQRARTPQTHVAAHMIRPRGAQVPWAAPRPTLPSCLAGSHIISGSGHGAPRASSLRASLDTIECAVLLRPPPRTTIRDGAAGSRCPARPNRRGGREPNAPAAATSTVRATRARARGARMLPRRARPSRVVHPASQPASHPSHGGRQAQASAGQTPGMPCTLDKGEMRCHRSVAHDITSRRNPPAPACPSPRPACQSRRRRSRVFLSCRSSLPPRTLIYLVPVAGLDCRRGLARPGEAAVRV